MEHRSIEEKTTLISLEEKISLKLAEIQGRLVGIESLDNEIKELDSELEFIDSQIKNIQWLESDNIKLIDLENKVGMINTLMSKKSTFISQAITLINDLSLEEKTLIVLKDIWGIVSEGGVDSLNEFVSDIVSSIFGREIEVRIEYVFKGKTRGADILIRDSLNDYGLIPYTMCGGSISIVLGIVLNVLFIQTRKLPKLMVLDETLSELGDLTLQGMVEYLRGLDFVIIVVSHDIRLRDCIRRVVEL